MSHDMPKGRRIYEGKAKVLFEGPEDGTLVQYFKDDTTAFNAGKHEIMSGKGILNLRISEFIFAELEKIGVPTHFIETISPRQQLIRAAEIIPLEVVMRNIAAGSLVKRLGLTEGDALPRPLVEFYYKDDALGDPLISEDHIAVFNLCSAEELAEIVTLAKKINQRMVEMFADVGIRLVDFKLEFGRVKSDDGTRIVLADEISPDSCRLWDIDSNEKMDKDRFRQNLGGMVDAYQQVAERLGLMSDIEEA
ncbi:MAG: Phosphoribosylaminoimidazole-succinocarboxamide synthase [Alphaproteobacteria bacterium]|nr:MAG: Phosphoribosylaminoimidazole-succinocarboxamide synthase [Alphaproteobacteria bacterium]